jgi:hypothetical protein
MKGTMLPRSTMRRTRREHEEAVHQAFCFSAMPLRNSQIEGRCKGGRDAEEADLCSLHQRRTGIECQPFSPRQPPMCPLSSRERATFCGVGKRSGGMQRHRDGLGAQQANPSASRLAAAPVSPQDGVRGRKRRWNAWRWWWLLDGPQHGADAARLLGGGSMSQALFPQVTGATMAHPSGIQNTHAAIAFGPPFLCIERLTCWTAQRPIRLGVKASPAKPPICAACAH